MSRTRSRRSTRRAAGPSAWRTSALSPSTRWPRSSPTSSSPRPGCTNTVTTTRVPLRSYAVVTAALAWRCRRELSRLDSTRASSSSASRHSASAAAIRGPAGVGVGSGWGHSVQCGAVLAQPWTLLHGGVGVLLPNPGLPLLLLPGVHVHGEGGVAERAGEVEQAQLAVGAVREHGPAAAGRVIGRLQSGISDWETVKPHARASTGARSDSMCDLPHRQA